MMEGQINPSHPADHAPPADCAHGNAQCPMDQLSEILGSNIQDILTSFIKGAEDGSRLALQKNRAGFTVQVVGPVRRGGEMGLRDSTAGRPLETSR